MLKVVINHLYERKTQNQERQSKIITYQPKNFEHSNNVDIKSVVIEHPRTSHKLSKTMRQAEKSFQVDSSSSLNKDTKE